MLDRAAVVILVGLAAEPSAPRPSVPDPAVPEPVVSQRDKIVWDAPEACPDADAIRDTIERYVARSLAEPADTVVDARAEVTPIEGATGFRMALRIETEDGAAVDRELVDDSCRVLADAAALMVAVALDPKAAARASVLGGVEPTRADDEDEAGPEPEPEATPEPGAEPEPEPESKPEPRPTPPPGVRRCRAGRSALRTTPRDLRPCASIDPRFGVQLGLLPGIAGPGVGGDIALLWPRTRIEIGGTHWFERPARREGQTGLGGDVRLSTGSLGACGRLGWAQLELPLCAGIELGAMRGQGVGISDPDTARIFWSAAWLGPRLAWVPVRRLALVARLDLVVPLARYRFDVSGLGTVHDVSMVGGRVHIGLGVRL